MTEYTDDVKLMLTTHPESRDSDTLLYEVFLKDKGYDTALMSVHGLLERIDGWLLPPFYSIARLRRKVQQECPDLRGKNYLKRHKLAKEMAGELQ